MKFHLSHPPAWFPALPSAPLGPALALLSASSLLCQLQCRPLSSSLISHLSAPVHEVMKMTRLGKKLQIIF